MKLKPRHYALALYHACKGTTAKETDRIVEGFIAFLKKKGHTKVLRTIVRELVSILAHTEGVHSVRITLAHKDAAFEKTLQEALVSLLGPHSRIESTVDPDLLAGATLRVDHHFIDASLRSMLLQFKNHLVNVS